MAASDPHTANTCPPSGRSVTSIDFLFLKVSGNGFGFWKVKVHWAKGQHISLVFPHLGFLSPGRRHESGAPWHLAAEKGPLAHPWFSLLVLEKHTLLREKKPWKFPSSGSSCFIIAIISDLLSRDHLSRIWRTLAFSSSDLSRVLPGLMNWASLLGTHTLFHGFDFDNCIPVLDICVPQDEGQNSLCIGKQSSTKDTM